MRTTWPSPQADRSSTALSNKVTLATEVSEESYLFLGAGQNEKVDQKNWSPKTLHKALWKHIKYSNLLAPAAGSHHIPLVTVTRALRQLTCLHQEKVASISHWKLTSQQQQDVPEGLNRRVRSTPAPVYGYCDKSKALDMRSWSWCFVFDVGLIRSSDMSWSWIGLDKVICQQHFLVSFRSKSKS